ncbi:hypothetical protein RHGRI_034076 [Rhododendron griersonianum]|uniref:Uncharacterized protein n=1 Tax=Rhododendron griersonianum TaxID=479676 RepID=A0AAV6I4Z5_9ERIC|nr:hypothetical protein RHGRI_034076 [Rhododendron griersonianum]
MGFVTHQQLGFITHQYWGVSLPSDGDAVTATLQGDGVTDLRFNPTGSGFLIWVLKPSYRRKRVLKVGSYRWSQLPAVSVH